MIPQPARILVIRCSGALGDVVLSLPVVKALRVSFPESFIEVSGNPSLLELARGPADSIAPPAEGIWNLFAEKADIPEGLTSHLAGFDLVVAFAAEDDVFVRRLREICPRVVAVDPVPKAGFHVMDWYLESVGARGSAVPQVRILPSWRDQADKIWKECGLDDSVSVIGFAPGSGSKSKNWPRERFETVCDNLLSDSEVGAVMEILGPAEVGEGPASVSVSVPGRIVMSNLPVGVLAAVLSKCSVYVGNDSGVSHLAAAVGTPTIALFGPTDPSVWGPVGDNVTILRPRTKCAPCVSEKRRRCDVQLCLESIPAEDVENAVRKILVL